MFAKLRNLSVAILALTCMLPLAHANEATKRAKLEELFTVMKMNSLMDQMMQAGMKQGEQIGRSMFGNKPISPEDQKIFDAWKVKATALMENTLSWDRLKPQYVDLYAKTYSEEDVDGMLAFYKSPAGQHMVEKTPSLLEASQKIVMDRMQDSQPQMQALVQNLIDQLVAAHPEMKSQQ